MTSVPASRRILYEVAEPHSGWFRASEAVAAPAKPSTDTPHAVLQRHLPVSGSRTSATWCATASRGYRNRSRRHGRRRDTAFPTAWRETIVERVKRSYHQHCGLAIAMDLVGERWAMLVVRDLAPGPRRFGDLLAGLPGLATDVLADRLRSLEESGVVAKRRLRYPAPASVYELTEYGRRLAEIGRDIAKWAEPLLPRPGDPNFRLNPQWALQSMSGAYEGGLEDGEYHFVVEDQDFTVGIAAGRAAVRYGEPSGNPTLRVECSADLFFDLASTPRLAKKPPAKVLVTGSNATLAAFFASMPLPMAWKSSSRQ